MKKFSLLIILLSFLIIGFSQQTILTDTTGKTCEIRGHLEGSISTITNLYCEPYWVDNDTVTMLVYPSCNEITFYCLRCEEFITVQEGNQYEIYWEKPKKLKNINNE